MRTRIVAWTVLLIGLAALAAPAAPAAPAATPPPTPTPNWYNVEVIVFRSMDPAAGSGETWPADPGVPDWATALPLNPPNSIGPAVPYQALSPVNEQLDEVWTRLKRSHDYQPLLHVTWVQPATDRATAPAVRIGVPASAVPASSTVPAPAAATGAAAPLQATPSYGSAKLSTTGQYLHFDLDLVLQGPLTRNLWPTPAGVSTTAMTAPAATTAAAAIPAPTFQLYRLRQDRRVNAGKLSYFDSPLFGAVVLITPARKP